jgi:hypothetical protein
MLGVYVVCVMVGMGNGIWPNSCTRRGENVRVGHES